MLSTPLRTKLYEDAEARALRSAAASLGIAVPANACVWKLEVRRQVAAKRARILTVVVGVQMFETTRRRKQKA